MSGPATASFSFAPLGTLRLAVVVAREAQLMHREYQEVFEDLQTRAGALLSAQNGAKLARQEHLKTTRMLAQRLLAQCQRLRKLAFDAGHPEIALEHGNTLERLTLPESGEASAWENSVLALKRESNRLSTLIDQAVDAAYRTSLEAVAEEAPQTLDDVLHVYVAQRALHTELQPAEAALCQDMVRRILGRLDLDAGETIPPHLEELGLALVLAPSMARAEALAVDLRLQVQQQRDRRSKSRAEAKQASDILEDMGDDAPPTVRALLEQVICLGEPLHPSTLTMAQQALATIDKANKQAQDAVAAEVLEQSLRDLGYDVQGVENTLFVDGGVTHFQRQGWEDYFVRLRVNKQDKTLNFNVVRQRGAQESAERRRLDTLAEDRWCAEFPRLQETLAARGIQLNVQRLLGAGELPVQVVDAGSTPALRSAAQDTMASHPVTKTRTL